MYIQYPWVNHFEFVMYNQQAGHYKINRYFYFTIINNSTDYNI